MATGSTIYRADVSIADMDRHYYGDQGYPFARADTLTSPDQVTEELDRLRGAGVTDLVLYPSSPDLLQVKLLADAVGGALGQPD